MYNMKILIVCRYKDYFPNHIMPFITEQAESVKTFGNNDIDYFLIQGKGFLSYFTNAKFLKQKINEFKPDLIHAHYGLSGLTAILQNKVPVVLTYHNGETATFLGNLFSSIAAIRSKHVIYVAKHIRDLSYFKSKRYSIIPCGVSLNDSYIIPKEEARMIHKMSNNKIYILFGGAFDNLRKNYPLLKDAIELLHNDNIVVIEMKGMDRKTITEYMCASDIFALPSKNEGSPQALKEAMVCNCPIIATDIADIRYLLGNIEGHYICKFDPNDLAEKIKQAIAFAKRTEGRKRIIELGLDNESIAKRLISIYENILK